MKSFLALLSQEESKSPSPSPSQSIHGEEHEESQEIRSGGEETRCIGLR
jgi:hypothetical protein